MTQFKRTTELLKEIADNAHNEAISVKEFNEKLGDRSFGIALIVFGILNNLPLMSAVFSIPVIYISWQMIIGLKQIHLPKFLEDKKFNEKTLARMIYKILPTLQFVEVFIKPRLDFMTSPAMERFVGVLCLILGIIIFLPFPGANTFPSFCVCLMAAAILEKDGLLMLVALSITIATLFAVQFVLVYIKDFLLMVYKKYIIS